MRIFLASFHTFQRFAELEDTLIRVFLAGGVTGNLKPLFNTLSSADIAGRDTLEKKLKIFLAGTYSRPYCMEKFIETFSGEMRDAPFILESFYYMDPVTEKFIPHFGDFLLDSGAFTFLSNAGKGKSVDWNEYIERYAAFIVKNRIGKFFELDIDSVVGYSRVKEFRRTLERLTGRQPIPVWHKSRGKDEFLRMCDEYPYVAIGGIVSKEIVPDEYRYFPWFISEAHRRGAKIHGLGFTSLDGMKRYHFDSVDSTAWTTGNRFGFIYRFDGKTVRKTECPPGHRIVRSREAALVNFGEWVKFQKFAETHL